MVFHLRRRLDPWPVLAPRLADLGYIGYMREGLPRAEIPFDENQRRGLNDVGKPPINCGVRVVPQGSGNHHRKVDGLLLQDAG